jgi:kynurenine formamidase
MTMEVHKTLKNLKVFPLILLSVISFDLAAQSNRNVTAQMVEEWMTELSNWGRWGADDELGALNLITPEKRIEAAKLVTTGISVSLAHNYALANDSASTPAFDHDVFSFSGPAEFVMDRISFSYHGNVHSHLDSLCHLSHNGQMYNGFSVDEVSEEGCNKLAITDVKEGIFTRGILLDIARLRGVDYLQPGTPIYIEDLEAWEEQAGIRAGPGDVIFVRTGRWITPEDAGQGSAGLHASVAPWLKARDVAIVGGDYANEVGPSGVEGKFLPIHQLTLVALGVRLFDNLDLEALAEEAARQGRWEFLLTASPIPVELGTGSPLNPIATF